MKKIIALILALLFCLPACAEITSEGSKIPSLLDDEVTAFAFHQKLDGFAEAEECIVRARYHLRLPDDTTTVDESILEAYSGMKCIYLIELGYIYIDPIMQSCFVCVGIDENGSMHNLPTPSDIVSRTYDIGIFDNVEITVIPTDRGIL